jgi:hypothetical protein
VPYSYFFVVSAVRAFRDTHPRGYQIVTDSYGISESSLVKRFQEDQERWNLFKKVVKWTERMYLSGVQRHSRAEFRAYVATVFQKYHTYV